MSVNRLFYGDNLDVLTQHVANDSVDLIYLDPPFNSNRNYNVIFNRHDTKDDDAGAQIQAFGDTWVWTPATETQYQSYIAGGLPGRVVDALSSFRTLLGENDAMAYLVNMAPRLVQMHRVLKTTGSLYLHADPTMSHYLKILLDTIFNAKNFQNEIIWCYEIGGRSKKRWARKHDVILFYTKSDDFFFDWTAVKTPRKTGTHMRAAVDEDGRQYQEKTDRKSGKVYRYYLDEGAIPPDFWLGIQQLNREAAERLGYPTQKPIALLEQILSASSKEGDVVLDPFCGCGTTIDAAVKLDRKWLGIDITYIAVDLIEKRLLHTYGTEIGATYNILGVPRDMASAQALFKRSPFDFERWAVSQVGGQPNAKQVGDRGIDGVVRFYTGEAASGKALVSVKGGAQLNPAMVRDLVGTVHSESADIGILVTMSAPTRGMRQAADHAGNYVLKANGEAYPKVQMLTIDDLLNGKQPKLPPAFLPYIAAQRQTSSDGQMNLFE